MENEARIVVGDALRCLRSLQSESVQCIVTSPPYWGLRSYGGETDMIGMERSFDDYVGNLVAVFGEAKRVLRGDGTLWLNLGDAYWGGKGRSSYAYPSTHLDRNTLQKAHHHTAEYGETRPLDEKHPVFKPKDLLLMPARIAMALQEDGWWLRSEIIWSKPNPFPESVTDRPTSAHEKLYLFSKSKKYFYDSDSVRTPGKAWKKGGFKGSKYVAAEGGDGSNEHGVARHRAGGYFVDKPGANLRNVWSIPTQSYKGAHFATFPEALVEPCIKAGTAKGATVLDPFAGSGTVGQVALRLERNAVLIEINPEYAKLAKKRIGKPLGSRIVLEADADINKAHGDMRRD